MIRINNFATRNFKISKDASGHTIRQGELIYGPKVLCSFREDVDNKNEDMELSVSPDITYKFFKEKKDELAEMYCRVLHIGNFVTFKPFEMIVSDVQDLNEAVTKAKAKAERDKSPNARLAISYIQYSGDTLHFGRFWYSYHSTAHGLDEKYVRSYFNSVEPSFPKRYFKQKKIYETYEYKKLLKIITFDKRQNLKF